MMLLLGVCWWLQQAYLSGDGVQLDFFGPTQCGGPDQLAAICPYSSGQHLMLLSQITWQMCSNPVRRTVNQTVAS